MQDQFTRRTYPNGLLQFDVRGRLSLDVAVVTRVELEQFWRDRRRYTASRAAAIEYVEGAILHRGNLGLSELLDDWLRSTRRFETIRWYSEEAWNRCGEWQSRPW